MSQHSTYTRTAIIRTEATPQIGYGQVMRCLALAMALSRENYRSVFLIPQLDGEIKNEIEKRGQLVRDLPGKLSTEQELYYLQELLEEYDSDLLVVDSYFIKEDYLNRVTELGVYLVALDDLAGFDPPADLILNSNLYITPDDYPGKSPKKLLLGPDYALLREEFNSARSLIRPMRDKTEVILVTLGGADPGNQTEKVLTALEGSQSGEIILLVVGIGSPYKKELLNRIRNFPKTVIPFIGVADMAQLMIFADLAISAGGLTCYELACLGVPHLIINLTADQEKNARELDKRGVSSYLGKAQDLSAQDLRQAIDHLAVDLKKRQSMNFAGEKLIDGQGGKRAVKKIVELTRQIKLGRKR